MKPQLVYNIIILEAK